LRGKCVLHMLYPEWCSLLAEDEAWRDGCVVHLPPVSVKVQCGDGAVFVEGFHGVYYGEEWEKEDDRGEHLRVEREGRSQVEGSAG
jgi:hypothetical protein